MYTTSVPAGSVSRLSASSTSGVTSYVPRDANALATLAPLAKETARSFDVPPINTVTFFMFDYYTIYSRF